MSEPTMMEAARNAIEAVEAAGFKVRSCWPVGAGLMFADPEGPAATDENGWDALMHLRARLSREPELAAAVEKIARRERPLAYAPGIEGVLDDERRAGHQRSDLAIDPNAGDCALMPKREG